LRMVLPENRYPFFRIMRRADIDQKPRRGNRL
jgi:hypothetical protein